TYDAGSSVSVQALPSTNYMFNHWVLDGSYAGTDNPTTVLMDDNHTLHAVFSLINYTLTITATTGGTTDPMPDTYVYASGCSVVVQAIPDPNYKFIHWEIDGSNITDNPTTVLMNKNYTLHAVFELLTYRLTILSSAGGTTDPTPGTYTHINGTYASVTAIPDEHYLLDYWLLDGNNVGSANPISVLMTDDHTLQPIFVLCNYTLTITATAGGTTSPVPRTYTYTAETSVEVTAIPDADYVFDHWELDGVDIGSANPYSVLMDSDHTLHAVFIYSPPPPLEPPIADFTWSPNVPKVGETVTFDASASYDPDGTIISYEWDFSDGGHATGKIVTHEFSTAGDFSVTLNVTDNDGLWCTKSKTITVVAPHGPEASFTPSFITIDKGETVTFDASASKLGWNGTHEIPITEYRWNFNGDGTIDLTTPDKIVTHTYTTAGNYYPKLTVYAPGAAPETDSATGKVTVRAPAPPPVGGYSEALSPSKFSSPPLALYILLIAGLTASTTLIKRKRK
ncbi:MAG: PKD domain-containing protein, partial [Thermoproteota archaeon]|nr:PKD domain-containing protein [Thermoproteota archaeon]